MRLTTMMMTKRTTIDGGEMKHDFYDAMVGCPKRDPMGTATALRPLCYIVPTTCHLPQ